MCRFALIAAKESIKLVQLLSEFADMAETSRAPDGDRQGDGWGIAWLDEKKQWQQYRSLKSIWEDRRSFATLPNMTSFAVHARSASFPQHKGILEYNQPYINGVAFVFNGLLRGVSFKEPVSGKIGAEKIYSLVKQELQSNDPEKALANVRDILIGHSREIACLNLGMHFGNTFTTLCYFKDNEAYYSLRKHESETLKIIASEPIGSYDFQKLDNNSITTIVFS